MPSLGWCPSLGWSSDPSYSSPGGQCCRACAQDSLLGKLSLLLVDVIRSVLHAATCGTPLHRHQPLAQKLWLLQHVHEPMPLAPRFVRPYRLMRSCEGSSMRPWSIAHAV